MQLLKYLQSQGLGSRKQCRQFIEDGRVTLNEMTPTDWRMDITPENIESLNIDNHPFIIIPLPYFYVLLNKPSDYETSHKPQHYPSIFSIFPDHMRQLPMQAVGRLDADTTGAILITNDGQFNHRQTSPKHHVQKRYQVTLKHPADQSLCDTLIQGVLLHDENEYLSAYSAQLTDPNTLIMVLTEGKYHQVKRMVAAAGNRVEALHREAFGEWTVDHLQPGEWQFIQP